MFSIIEAPAPTPVTFAVTALAWMAPEQVMRTVTSAILERGGWLLESKASSNGQVEIVFEFACDASLEFYSALVTCGLSVSRGGHMDLTRLWLCSRHRRDTNCLHVARIALTVNALGDEAVKFPSSR